MRNIHNQNEAELMDYISLLYTGVMYVVMYYVDT